MNAQFSVITFIAAGVTVFCVWCLAATYSEAGGEIRIQGSKDIRVEAQLEGSRKVASPSKETGK